jgi:3-oxoacyl-[acyl-carrier-protein] synthase II
MSRGAPIVVTGVGLVTPLGVGREAVAAALTRDAWPVADARPIHGGALRCDTVARVPEEIFPPATRTSLGKLDAMIRFAVAAAREAADDARIADVDLERVGCVLGNLTGGLGSAERELPVLCARGPRRVSPYLAISMYYAGSIGAVSIELGLRGPLSLLASGETAGADALAHACAWLEDGEADLVLAGGTEAPLTAHCLAAFERRGLLATPRGQGDTRMRPFGPAADGFVLGEGAAVLALERLDHAIARGARVRARVATTRLVLGRERDAAARALAAAAEDALARAGLTRDALAFTAGSGCALPEPDGVERAAIARLLGEEAALTSLKPRLGHALGASGALEAAVALLCLERSLVPGLGVAAPSAPAAGLGLRLVVGAPRPTRGRGALCLSLGLHGEACVTAFAVPPEGELTTGRIP